MIEPSVLSELEDEVVDLFASTWYFIQAIRELRRGLANLA
jgi:hypothetical protein